jgi:hypothetical protein
VTRVIDRPVIVLAELGWWTVVVVVEPTASAAEVTTSTKVAAIAEVSTSVEVASSAVISACLKVSTPTEASTTTTWGVSRDTSTDGYATLVLADITSKRYLPLEDTPAPISMSGSSITIPPSSCRPPVPPCSAVKAHLRSASVSRATGTTLIPVW